MSAADGGLAGFSHASHEADPIFFFVFVFYRFCRHGYSVHESCTISGLVNNVIIVIIYNIGKSDGTIVKKFNFTYTHYDQH